MNRTTDLISIIKAQSFLKKYMRPTPLHYYPGLSSMFGAELYVKHENHTAIGSFKVRGGLNAIGNLTENQRQKGVAVASTGNFGQSVAYASGLFGVNAVVALPNNPNPSKAEAIRNFGANLILYGDDYDASRDHLQDIANEKGYLLFNDAEDPNFIAGLGTCMLEIITDLPDVEVVIVPIGGAGFASGICIAGKSINPNIELIGVSSEEAQSPYLSWQSKELIEAPTTTFAEGIAVRVSFEGSQEVIRDLLDEYVLVSEDDIRRAVVQLLEKTNNLAEGAGAAPLAAAQVLANKIKGRKTVLILSGGNISLQHLKECLDSYSE